MLFLPTYVCYTCSSHLCFSLLCLIINAGIKFLEMYLVILIGLLNLLGITFVTCVLSHSSSLVPKQTNKQKKMLQVAVYHQ